MPKARGQTKEQNDLTVARLIMKRIVLFFTAIFKCVGTPPAALQARADTLSEIIYDKDLESGLLEAAERVTGATRVQIRRGFELQELNKTRSAYDARTSVPRAKRKDWVDPDPIYEWFHSSSPDIEVSKADKGRYKRKLVFCAGKWRNLECEHRVLNCTKVEAVRHFMESEYWVDWLRQNPERNFGSSQIQQCICPCMKPRRGSDCACPYCVEYEEALLGWHTGRSNWHRELAEGETCGCRECADPNSNWRAASANFSHLRAAALCSKVPHPGLELPHFPDDLPSFYKLCCCKLDEEYPDEAQGHLPACSVCGWARRLSAGRACSVTYSDKPATWRRYEHILTGDRRGRDKKLVKHVGARRELMEWLEEHSKYIFYHLWLVQWTKWQRKLAIATFDPRYEIVIVIDWAAAYEMKGDVAATCERPVSCKQLVALVLSRPSPTVVGHEREVVCDYWRWWTDNKQNARMNMLALREIANYYRYNVRWSVPRGSWNAPRGVGPMPHLRRMLIFADGSTTQNKGRKFFGREARGPHPDVQLLHPPVEPGSSGSAWGADIEMSLDVGAPHHGSGAVDSAGKDARVAMDRAVIHDRLLTIFDFAACWRWCVEHMVAPSTEHTHRGTFGCNGSYFWGAISSGEFPNPDGFPVINSSDESNFDPIEGSRQLFCFRALHTSVAEISASFVSCYCAAYLDGEEEQCAYRHIAGSRRFEVLGLRRIAGRRNRRPRGQNASDSE